ncbi:unnamed protein product [Fusarium equiseti]|uniref:2EXR domain-containing protein n=1 Tax=Fusarium equiseti TaxID=61235 RepID=A0A8J2IZZ6_FUSEQ|nr:unnamed protein product [Fusarium equiseti]
MTSQRHLEVFNPAPQLCPDFHQFRRFPVEVRCLIWEQALSHERWIRIDLHSPKNWETLPDPHPPGEYEFTIYKQWKISKLFRTTRESRRVALGFYRVQLPCWHRWDRKRDISKKTTLYICPELDTLEVKDMRTNSCDGTRSPSYHACPVYGSTLGFKRLPFDPRLGDKHLKRISTGPHDPRPEFHEWFRTLQALGVQHHHKVNYQFGICTETDSGRDVQKRGPYTNDRDAAAKWFYQNEQGFQSKWQERFAREGMEYPPIEEQGLEHAPQQAIGFWLFSLESIAPLPDIDTSFRRYRPCCPEFKRIAVTGSYRSRGEGHDRFLAHIVEKKASRQ